MKAARTSNVMIVMAKTARAIIVMKGAMKDVETTVTAKRKNSPSQARAAKTSGVTTKTKKMIVTITAKNTVNIVKAAMPAGRKTSPPQRKDATQHNPCNTTLNESKSGLIHFKPLFVSARHITEV